MFWWLPSQLFDILTSLLQGTTDSQILLFGCVSNTPDMNLHQHSLEHNLTLSNMLFLIDKHNFLQKVNQ